VSQSVTAVCGTWYSTAILSHVVAILLYADGVAVAADRSTNIFRVVSIGRRKCCLVIAMTWLLTCGA